MMKNSNYQKHVDELLALTKEALHYVEKRNLSKVSIISNKRKKLFNKLKFKSVPSDKLDAVRWRFEDIQEIDASIKTFIEAERSELLKRICLIKKELKLRDRFIGPRKSPRKIIDGKL